MRYTLVPPHDDGKELCVSVGFGYALVRKDKPIICQTDADLLRWATVAPYLRIVELGITGEEMLAQANAVLDAAEAPEPVVAAPEILDEVKPKRGRPRTKKGGA